MQIETLTNSELRAAITETVNALKPKQVGFQVVHPPQDVQNLLMTHLDHLLTTEQYRASLFYKATVNTMRANRFELFCARLFGKKFEGWDGSYKVQLSTWRGKVYFLDFKRSK